MNRALTAPEETALVALIEASRRHAERDAALIRLPLETGLRLGEVSGLNWQDLLTVHGEICPQFTLRKEIAKFKKPRFVFLNRHILPILQLYRAWYQRRYNQSNGPLWISTHNRRMSPRQIERITHGYLIGAGLPGVTFHSLRHTFALKALRQSSHGAEPVRRLLGHNSLSTTQIYLSSLDQSALIQAVDW
ncbi:MAG: tyrosine-type recombinase/integrase [Patescibacteria group bacterium]